jgi:hypothetical protein
MTLESCSMEARRGVDQLETPLRRKGKVNKGSELLDNKPPPYQMRKLIELYYT